MDKYETFRNKLVQYLKDRNTYDVIDDYLIDKIVKLEERYDELEVDIVARGSMVNIRKEGEEEYIQTNNSVNNQYAAIKLQTALMTKMGLTVLDRVKLKLKDKPKKSKLDSLLDMPGQAIG